MEKLVTELYNLLLKYEEYIDVGNRTLIEKYGLEVSPLRARRMKIIPQTGMIKSPRMTFRFHGAGVCLNLGGVIIDFDYPVGSQGFDPHKFEQFLKSYPDTPIGLLNENEFNTAILKLLKQGIIKEKGASDTNTYKYVRVK